MRPGRAFFGRTGHSGGQSFGRRFWERLGAALLDLTSGAASVSTITRPSSGTRLSASCSALSGSGEQVDHDESPIWASSRSISVWGGSKTSPCRPRPGRAGPAGRGRPPRARLEHDGYAMGGAAAAVSGGFLWLASSWRPAAAGRAGQPDARRRGGRLDVHVGRRCVSTSSRNSLSTSTALSRASISSGVTGRRPCERRPDASPWRGSAPPCEYGR